MELFILFRFGRLTVWNKKWNKVVQSQFKFIPFFIPFGRNGTQNQNRDPPSGKYFMGFGSGTAKRVMSKDFLLP